MTETEGRFTPDNQRELSPDAKEIIGLFQKAKATENKEEQIVILRKFADKLNQMIGVEKRHFTWTPDKQLAPLIIDGSDKSPFPISTGTEGQRIYFSSKKPYELKEKSSDGKNKWMFYPEPPADDQYHGEIFYRRFIEQFGEEIVDMSQELNK
jgi:hypothetical protein